MGFEAAASGQWLSLDAVVAHQRDDDVPRGHPHVADRVSRSACSA